MVEQAVAVVDTNVLLNLATPVVDGYLKAPSGAAHSRDYSPRMMSTTLEILLTEYLAAVLSYYVDTKGWDAQYVVQLRQQYL